WIPSGQFSMGSPDGEPLREDDEHLHVVELSEGLWLWDTACTQALWEAVMGDNPSDFKGPERPVENVSWEDVQEFFVRLNATIPGLEAGLPREAQWEYACRAGTTTPFSFGTQITPEQVNYDGNHPYEGGRKGLYRKETVPVRSLPPNAWGLYEMHGNVWEWCTDWFGEYPGDGIVDPGGPNEGTARVIRGGAWDYSAGICRSACRGRGEPVGRVSWIGFRGARVHVPEASGQAPSRAG
ncbi:MAG: sulfatase modifying factor 1, partial [Candidatus Omnitrophota bacterium]